MDSKRSGRTKRQTFTRRAQTVLLSCTAIIALSPVLVAAQEANSGSGTVLQTITVSGNGGDDDSKTIVAKQTTSGSKMKTDILDVPAAVSVITSKEMQERAVQTIEQALQYTAGVNTDFYGSDERFEYFKIRGFDAYTYRDGLPIGRPFLGIREEPYAYERIEVLKGGNSSTFGISDPGGSVNYATKLPKSQRFGEAYVTGGSYNSKEVGVDFGDNITSDDTLSYRFTGKLRDADAEHDYSRDNQKFFMGGLTWRPTDATTLSVVYDHLNKDGTPNSSGYPVGTHFDRSTFFGEPDYHFLNVERNSLSVMFDHDFGSGFTLSSNARYSHTNADYGYAYIAATPPTGTTATRSFVGSDGTTENFLIDTRLQYDTTFDQVESRSLVGVFYNDFKEHSLGYYQQVAPGIDWTNPIYSGGPSYPDGPYGNSTTDKETKALYFQQEFTFFDKLIVSGGIRNDWMDISNVDIMNSTQESGDLSEFTTRLGATYKFTDEMAVYASYAESAVPAGAISVQPERGEQYEIGFKYRPDDFPALFSAAIYDLRKNNITVTDPVTLQKSTIGEVRVRGLDLEAKAELTNNISLTAAYSYLDAEIVDNGGDGTEGNRPQSVPKSVASIWATYLLEGNGSRGDMTFGLGGRYSDTYFFDNANTQSADSAVIFDAAYTWEIVENTSLQVNVNNLFDEKHVAYGGFGADYYNPGRSFSATLRRTW